MISVGVQQELLSLNLLLFMHVTFNVDDFEFEINLKCKGSKLKEMIFNPVTQSSFSKVFFSAPSTETCKNSVNSC